MAAFAVGDRVVRNPATWQPSEFDSWGRGVGVGVVVESPFAVDDLGMVDVRWPAGRCFEATEGLLPAPPDQDAEPGAAADGGAGFVFLMTTAHRCPAAG